MLPEKRCTHCGETKAAEDFGKHPTTRDGRQSWCKACTREASRKIYREQPEHCKAQVSEWYHANRDYVRSQAKARYQANREQLVAEEARRRAVRRAAGIKPRLSPAAKERKKHSYRRWQQAHPEAVRAYARRYYAEKHGQVRGYQHNRRARKQRNGGVYTNEAWVALCAKYDHQCLRCGEPRPLTVDHVRPLSMGGPNTIENIQPLCKPCNSRKKHRWADYRNLAAVTAC